MYETTNDDLWPDPGLPEAVQRVRAAYDIHATGECTDGPTLDDEPAAWEEHIFTEAARAARADYPDVDAIVRNAKAEALRDFADTKVHNQTPGRMAEDLHAEADRLTQETKP
jgi:hypothetical protein